MVLGLNGPVWCGIGDAINTLARFWAVYFWLFFAVDALRVEAKVGLCKS